MIAPRAVLVYWLPPLLWMAVIFVGSTNLLSTEHTSRFAVPFLRWLLGDGYTEAKASFAHFLIRKMGHFTEYALLCGLLWRALKGSRQISDLMGASKNFLGAVGLAAFYAASDEFHQSFVPTRTASVEDVFIDTGGAALGLLIGLGVNRWLCRQDQEAATKPWQPQRDKF